MPASIGTRGSSGDCQTVAGVKRSSSERIADQDDEISPSPGVYKNECADRHKMEEEMGRVVVTEFVSLDGVMEDPGGAENFRHGGWSFEFSRGEEGDKFKLDETLSSE